MIAATSEPNEVNRLVEETHSAVATELDIAAKLDEPGAVDVSATAALALADDEALELLRDLLCGDYRRQVFRLRNELAELENLLDEMERQLRDKEALVATITPVMAGAIRTSISESRNEMVDALYPIMGKLVQRSVTEAMRDLARRIDQQMRRTFQIKSAFQRFAARLRGVSDAEFAMRAALPTEVLEIFLIHRETGLLLLHVSAPSPMTADSASLDTSPVTTAQGKLEGPEVDEPEGDDSDLISGMLTAIRDFAEDAFGRGEEGDLNEIQYGDKTILIEGAHLVYIATVMRGIQRGNLRAEMRETMIAIEHQHANALEAYDGNAARFESDKASLAALLTL
ncbi:MAG: hypothetical protein R3C14_28465 [Caldilineaceae bacterium]